MFGTIHFILIGDLHLQADSQLAKPCTLGLTKEKSVGGFLWIIALQIYAEGSDEVEQDFDMAYDCFKAAAAMVGDAAQLPVEFQFGLAFLFVLFFRNMEMVLVV